MAAITARPGPTAVACAVATVASALLASALLVPGAARAGAWDVYSNANALTSVAAIDSYVWAPSLKGVHRYDPATHAFQRYFRDLKGLRSNSVTAVARDSSGTIWFGTAQSGVSLLAPDGTWGVVSAFEGLPSDQVTALEPYLDGMWVGTKGGLAFFIGTEIQALWPDGANPSPFRSNFVTDVESHGGRTWVATQGGIYTTTVGVSWDSTVAGLTTRNARSLAHDGSHLWAVTADGKVWSGGETGAWTETAAGLDTAAGVSLAARGGVLCLGAARGVYRWDATGGAWVALEGPGGAAVDVSGDGTIWAGNVSGLWEFSGTGWVIHRSAGPLSNWIHGSAMQGSTVYFTTRDGGVARYDDARGWRIFVGGGDPDTSLLSSDYIFSCLVDRENYKWFGDWGGSIARLDDSGPVPHFVHFFSPDTSKYTIGWASAHDPQGPRWFGLDTGCRGCGPGFEAQGLIRIDDDGTRTNYQPTNSAMTSVQIRSIAYAPDGTMWVGYADFGVDLFTDHTLAVRRDHLGTADGLPSNNVWAIAIAGTDAWVSTDGGLTRFALGGARPAKAEFLPTPVISQNGAVNPLAVDAQGGLWLGTGSGLWHRPPGGSAEIFNVLNSPIVSNDVHAVSIDRTTGDIWIGTGEGANRLRPGQLGGGGATPSTQLVFGPNPARFGAGVVRFTVSTSTGTPLVRTPVEVYDLAGRLLVRLQTDGRGAVSWDGTRQDGRRLGGGIYFLRALAISEAGRWETSARGRLVLLP